ncbi:MAG: hypothetical protein QM640_01455 [Niabella sp.]
MKNITPNNYYDTDTSGVFFYITRNNKTYKGYLYYVRCLEYDLSTYLDYQYNSEIGGYDSSTAIIIRVQNADSLSYNDYYNRSDCNLFVESYSGIYLYKWAAACPGWTEVPDFGESGIIENNCWFYPRIPLLSTNKKLKVPLLSSYIQKQNCTYASNNSIDYFWEAKKFDPGSRLDFGDTLIVQNRLVYLYKKLKSSNWVLISNSVRFSVPVFPYLLSRCWEKVPIPACPVGRLLFFVSIAITFLFVKTCLPTGKIFSHYFFCFV